MLHAYRMTTCCQLGLLLLPALVRADVSAVITTELNGLQVDIDRKSGTIMRLAYPEVGTILRAREGDGGLLDLAYLAREHRVKVATGEQWASSEFWLTPHAGGWAKGIGVFRGYVRRVNPRRELPRHVRDGLGFRTVRMVQAMETDPAHAAFKYTDLPHLAQDARDHGIDEMVLLGAIRGFRLPLELEDEPGAPEAFFDAYRQCEELGVNVVAWTSISLLELPTLKRYGINSGAPSWVYHPKLIGRNSAPAGEMGTGTAGTKRGGRKDCSETKEVAVIGRCPRAEPVPISPGPRRSQWCARRVTPKLIPNMDPCSWRSRHANRTVE